MKLKLAEVRIEECSKPNCSKRLMQRHHKGCERMWLKHFKRRCRTLQYKTFEKRYWEFRKEDCALICEAHHHEIHRLYVAIIAKAMVIAGYKPMIKWTWEEAELLMNLLRKVCDEWLKTKTPGLKRRKPMPWQRKRVTK